MDTDRDLEVENCSPQSGTAEHAVEEPADEPLPVDADVGTAPLKGSCPSPHAREETSPTDPPAPRHPAQAAAQRREVRTALGRRTAPLWPAHAAVAPSTAEATRRDWQRVYRLAGWEIQYHALVLRRITTAYVVDVARPCFEAGWSIADILHALDWTPQGVRYTHDSVTGIENPGAWFAARLRAWTHQDGTPMRSLDQRAAAEAEQRRAQALAAAERHAAREVHPQTAGVEPGVSGAAVVSEQTTEQDRQPFRVRWAAQIAAGRAEASRSPGNR